MRSVPPARTRMFDPCLSRKASASSIVRGRRSLKSGRLIGASGLSCDSRGIEWMALGPFAFVPERAAVLAEACRSGGVNAFGQVQCLVFILCPQRGENPFGSERRFVETYSDSVVNCVGDRGDCRRQRSFATFFGAERPFGIDALDNDGFDGWRFDR